MRMLKPFLVISFCVLFSFSGFSQMNQENYIRLKFNNRLELNRISEWVSVDQIRGNTVTAYANNKEISNLKKAGFSFEFLAHPSSMVNSKSIVMASTIADMANWDRYPTYEVYVQMMQNFEQKYPSICKLITIGTLPSGRKLLALKISDNVAVKEAETEFFYTSTIHGDETAGYVLMLRLIDYLLTNYNTDSKITTLINSLEIFINPNANPDGTYSAGNSSLVGSQRSNANFVDINRNFPDPRKGDHPDGNAWQNETIEMMKFASVHNFSLSANYHGGAEVVNFPWDSWTGSAPDNKKHPDDAWFQTISKRYTAFVHAQSTGTNYMRTLDGASNPTGIINGGDWYVITGGRQDYMTYFKGCREITFEISNQKLLNSEDLPLWWNYHRDALIGYIGECLNGINGVIKDNSGLPLQAKVKVESLDEANSIVNSELETGFYNRMLLPGTYTVTYSKTGYAPVTITNLTVPATGSITQNVVLQQLAGNFNVNFKVTNKLNALPVFLANITVNSQTVATNSNGLASLGGITAGTYNITIKCSGYLDYNSTLTVNGNQIENIQLSPGDVGVFDVLAAETSRTFPNPFSNQVIFQYSYPESSKKVKICFYNSLAILVGTFYSVTKSGENLHHFMAENLPAAVYFYTIEIDNKAFSKGKIIKAGEK